MRLNIGGLISGNDYKGMVDQIMAARRVPIESKKAKLEDLDYDMGAWAQMRTLAQDLTASLNKLRGFDLWRNMSVDSTNASAVTAAAATATAEQEYEVIVSKRAQAQSFSTGALDVSQDLIAAGSAVENDVFEIEGQQITIGANETLETLRNKINAASSDMDEEKRVRASIISNRLVIRREQTGAGSVALHDVTGTSLQKLGILNASGDLLNENVPGQDAAFTVNGIPATSSSNDEVKGVVAGVTLTLRGVGSTTLKVRPDREAVKEAILDFVEKYNAFAKQSDSYSKIAMGQSSELVQKGELYGDSLMMSIESSIRKYVTDVKSPALNASNAGYIDGNGVQVVMDSLSDLGIWTVGERNELQVVDAGKLDKALEHHFDLSEQLFKGVFDSEKVAYAHGVASDFYQYISKISEDLTGNIDARINTLTEKYDELSDEIDEMEDGLADYEQKQWAIFTRMEDALATMKSQQSYISSVFGQKS